MIHLDESETEAYMREDVSEQRWRRESRLELGNRNVDMISPVTKYDLTWPTDGYVLEILVRGIQLLDCPFPASNKW
jgi:hypothetical protein